MQEVTGNLWDFYDKGNWIVIPTNGVVRKDEEAVMGRGVALQARIKFPKLPLRLARSLGLRGNVPHPFHDIKIITFPTKYHWVDSSNLNLVEGSCKELVKGMLLLGLEKLYLPRVGCGSGRLAWKDVKPILERYLDDRFVVVSL